ncbi:MAG: two-CW domain-containing protein [Thermodesulfobacteriota bacterium]
MSETQCWEFTNCKSKEKCPAYPDKGRECWEVPGTLCRGQTQGGPEEKKRDCITLCKFMEGIIGGKI